MLQAGVRAPLARSMFSAVIPGRERFASEPGIHGHSGDAYSWIPGLRQAAHPGMTGERLPCFMSVKRWRVSSGDVAVASEKFRCRLIFYNP
jgi:hypothetical protein